MHAFMILSSGGSHPRNRRACNASEAHSHLQALAMQCMPWLTLTSKAVIRETVGNLKRRTPAAPTPAAPKSSWAFFYYARSSLLLRGDGGVQTPLRGHTSRERKKNKERVKNCRGVEQI